MFKEKKTKALIILKRKKAQDYKMSSTKLHMTLWHYDKSNLKNK